MKSRDIHPCRDDPANRSCDSPPWISLTVSNEFFDRVEFFQDVLRATCGVDELGGLHEALAYVAKKAKLETYETHLLPEPEDLFSGLFAPARSDHKDDEFIRMRERSPASAMKAYLDTQPVLRLLDPHKRAAVDQFVAGLEAFQNERILLIAPHFTNLSQMR